VSLIVARVSWSFSFLSMASCCYIAMRSEFSASLATYLEDRLYMSVLRIVYTTHAHALSHTHTPQTPPHIILLCVVVAAPYFCCMSRRATNPSSRVQIAPSTYSESSMHFYRVALFSAASACRNTLQAGYHPCTFTSIKFLPSLARVAP
jgi:hypothetical protein